MGKVGFLQRLRREELHLLCSTNRVPISYELTPANVADVSLTEELIAEAALGEEVARRLLGDLAYSSEQLRKVLAEELGILLATERAERRHGSREQIEIALSSLKRVFGLGDPGGHHAHRAGHQDRGEDSGLHLRVFGQPAVGSSSREDQGLVGLEPDNTHLASRGRASADDTARVPSRHSKRIQRKPKSSLPKW